MIQRYHASLIVGVRFMYGLRIADPISIGMSDVEAWRFVLFNLLGAAVWAMLITGAGFLFGQPLQWMFTNIKQYEKNELSITYQYQMTPETLKITGTNELVGGFAIGPNIVHRLAVYLLFLDNQGIVIENVLVYAGDYVGVIPLPMEFERTIPIPEGAKMISFAYDGVVPGEYTIGFSPSRQ
ncbi:MAG: hypothetical protein NTU74_21540 [Deltaproteobacteria bacterium]|nr:hypothetical protein [Deltaproteobacteria bacterium]